MSMDEAATTETRQRVCAVVVTFNRVELLRRLLESLREQHRPPDAVLVVDNASADETPGLLKAQYPEVHVLRLAENRGGAGGFHAGMDWACQNGFEWIWIMDDDVTADPACLHTLFATAETHPLRVLVPRRLNEEGQEASGTYIFDDDAQWYFPVLPDPARPFVLVDMFTFEGPLFHRSVLEAVGLPNPNLFILWDDAIYSAQIYKRFGPGSAAFVYDALLGRQRPVNIGEARHSWIKRWLFGRSGFLVLEDHAFWRMAYNLRNRHLLWKTLGWRRRRVSYLLLHAGFIIADGVMALRNGWRWRKRLKWNLRAWWLGAWGDDRRFLDPAQYQAE